MACNEVDFTFDNECLHVTVGDDYSTLIHSNRDLTNYTITMDIQTAKDTAPVLSLAITADVLLTGFYISDAAAGDFKMIIQNSDTTAVGEGVYLYAITLIDSNSLRTSLLQGHIEFKETIL
jgi:hypothetical protein